MITHIHYSNGFYAIEIDGQIVDHASTQHEADVLLSTIQEAEASWQMGGMSNVGQPMLRCGLPNPLCRVQQVGNICQSCGHVSLTWLCPTCDDGGPGGIDLYAAAFEEDEDDSRPLLAQCAEVIRACLGGPVATSGIVDELRRVERALAREGW